MPVFLTLHLLFIRYATICFVELNCMYMYMHTERINYCRRTLGQNESYVFEFFMFFCFVNLSKAIFDQVFQKTSLDFDH